MGGKKKKKEDFLHVLVPLLHILSLGHSINLLIVFFFFYVPTSTYHIDYWDGPNAWSLKSVQVLYKVWLNQADYDQFHM